MPRQSTNLPARRPRNAVATRRRPPARNPRSPYQSSYGQGYGYGGHVDRYGNTYRSRGQLNRAQAAQAAYRVYKVGEGVYKIGRGAIRHRQRLAAFYSVAAIAGTGAITALMPSGIVVATVAGAAPTVYGGLKLRSARRRGENAKLTSGQIAGWAARLGTALWLPLTAAFGFADPLRLALAAGSAVGVSWWHVHHRQQQLELEPAPAPEWEPGPIELTWSTYIGCQGGILAGSFLTGIEENPNGWAATIQLVPGRQRPESAISAVGNIASAYGIDPTRVMVERMPDGRADQARIEVYQANPLQKVHEFTGPTLDTSTGWITIGDHPDSTTAKWRLFEPGSGPCGGMIFGAQGSGKSALCNEIAAEITHSGIATLWLADGQEGLSMPDWSEHGADWFSFSLTETRRMLQAAEQVMYSRQKRRRRMRWVDADGNTVRGKGSFDGTPEEPYLYVMVDEWPIVAQDPECRRIVALLLKAGRKVGITCIIIGQIPSVAEFGGDNDASVIRSLSSTTNVVMFRTAPADKSSQHMGGMGVDGVDPTAIPAAFPDGTGTQGMGYVRAPGGTASVFRSKYVRSPIHWARTAPETFVEQDAVDAAGEHYQNWRERYARVLDGEDDPADLIQDEDPRDEVPARLANIPRQRGPQNSAVRTVVPMPQHAQATTRSAALQILRGTGQMLTTAQLATHVRALTGADVERNAVLASLKRAAEDGEVVQLPPLPTGKDRSARWQAAEYATEESNHA